MDEKEKLNPVSESEDSTLEEKDGVKYETNDNWKFDAEAPSLENEITLGDGTEISLEAEEPEAEKKSESYETLERPKAKKSDEKTSDKPKNEKVKNKDKPKFILLGFLVALIIAAMVFLGVRYYTVPNGEEGKNMNYASVACVIDGTKVSIGTYNYYYSSIVSYYEQYAQYGYFQLDTTKPYDEQTTTDPDTQEEISWEQFFRNETMSQIKQSVVYYNKGKAAGVTLTDKQKETIDSQIDSLKSTASEQGVALDEYIQATFGKYCTESTIRLMLEQYYITANYRGYYYASTKISDDEFKTYFNKHEQDYYTINFAYLALPYDSEKKDESVKKAEKYTKKIKDEKSLKAIVPEVYKDYIDQEVASKKETAGDSFNETEARQNAIKKYESQTSATITRSQSPFDEKMNDWLFNRSTKVGSTKYYIDEESGYMYIVLKTEMASLDEEKTYSVRHILITPESESQKTDDSGRPVYTDDEKAAAKDSAEALLGKYLEGDKTEYSFALLADENSTDTASTSSGSSGKFGGLYEGVKSGQMVPSFEEWSTSKDRKYGDTAVLESDYGYHIMFFINNNVPSYKASVTAAIKEENLEKMYKEAVVKEHKSVIEKANGVESVSVSEQSTDTQAADTASDTSANSGN